MYTLFLIDSLHERSVTHFNFRFKMLIFYTVIVEIIKPFDCIMGQERSLKYNVLLLASQAVKNISYK